MQASVPVLDPAEVIRRATAAAVKHRFRLETFGQAEGRALLALTRRTPGPRPRVYLSTGIHGDEPASVSALLGLLEAGTLDGRADWFLCPLLNPAGLARGTRENAQGIDLNRDYRLARAGETRDHIAWLRRQPNFELSICLHEDWESVGFYLYERAVGATPAATGAALEAAGRVLPIDRSSKIDDFEASDGIIRPSFDFADREGWPESVYLYVRHHTLLHYTMESPSKAGWDKRIAAHQAAVAAVLRAFLDR